MLHLGGDCTVSLRSIFLARCWYSARSRWGWENNNNNYLAVRIAQTEPYSYMQGLLRYRFIFWRRSREWQAVPSSGKIG